MPDYLDLLRPLLTTGNVMYFAYDLAAQRVVYVSEAYEQLIGDPLHHLADDLPHLLSRLHPDDRQYLGQLLAEPTEAVHEVELRLARPQPQAWQWLSASLRRTQPAAGPTYLVGAVRDITAIKEAARNAQKFNTKKDATLEILAHDLATPFSLLLQLTEQLTYEVSDASEMVRKLLHLMQSTCTHGINLIHDFVDNEFWSRPTLACGRSAPTWCPGCTSLCRSTSGLRRTCGCSSASRRLSPLFTPSLTLISYNRLLII